MSRWGIASNTSLASFTRPRRASSRIRALCADVPPESRGTRRAGIGGATLAAADERKRRRCWQRAIVGLPHLIGNTIRASEYWMGEQWPAEAPPGLGRGLRALSLLREPTRRTTAAAQSPEEEGAARHRRLGMISVPCRGGPLHISCRAGPKLTRPGFSVSGSSRAGWPVWTAL